MFSTFVAGLSLARVHPTSCAQKIVAGPDVNSRAAFDLRARPAVRRGSPGRGRAAAQRRGLCPLVVSEKLLPRRRLPSGAVRRTGRDQKRHHVARRRALQRRPGEALARSVLSCLRQGAGRHSLSLSAAVRFHSALVVSGGKAKLRGRPARAESSRSTSRRAMARRSLLRSRLFPALPHARSAATV
jgi:hypothetical protein